MGWGSDETGLGFARLRRIPRRTIPRASGHAARVGYVAGYGGWDAVMDYGTYLQRKRLFDAPTGLETVPPLPAELFPFQRDIVAWALRRGRAAIFAGTGLGKSFMELAWANAVHQATGGNVLLITPLAVAAQMVREGSKFHIEEKKCATQADVEPGISITNYEKLHHFDLSKFAGVILDESSILKSYNGKTRNQLIEQCQQVPFRLAATATPAPNDFMELGNHAEFLGVMSYVEMLAMFFVHDGGETSKWRLKGHAESEFWKWMCSWAVMMRKPSDLGYENGRFDLPPLMTHQHTVAVEYKPDMETGFLFPVEAQTLGERISARRSTVDARVEAASALVNGSDKPWVCWCNLNSESDALEREITGAVQVRGSDSEAKKERALEDFALGRIRVLVTKPSICGFGLNWQHCRNTVFVGLNDSFEQVFQSIRRFWRFGQTEPVHVHFIASEIEGAVVSNLRRKEADAERMVDAMIHHMADLNSAAIRGQVRDKATYEPQKRLKIPSFLGAA